MRKLKLPFLAFAISCSTSALADSTQCMDMGGIIHCNTISGKEMRSTDCMRMGGGMTTCNSIGSGSSANGESEGDRGSAGADGLAAIITAIQERSFRKKVGKMLANGECEEASKFAFTKGKIELGTSIAQMCKSSARQPESPSEDINGKISLGQRLAQISLTKTPIRLNDYQIIENIRYHENQLLHDISIDTDRLSEIDAKFLTHRDGETIDGWTELIPELTSDFKNARMAGLCSSPYFAALLKDGAIIIENYKDKFNRGIGTVLIRNKSCIK